MPWSGELLWSDLHQHEMGGFAGRRWVCRLMSFLAFSGLCLVPGEPQLSSCCSLGRHGHLTSRVSSPFQPWAFTSQIKREPLTLCSGFKSLWLGHVLPLCLCPAAGEHQEVVMIVRAMLVRHPQCPGDFPGRRTDVRGHYSSHPGQQPLKRFS